MPEPARLPSLDGLTFRAVGAAAGGAVDARTTFTYHQQGRSVWAEYAGGVIELGRLVGTRDGDTLAFRYVHLDTAGLTASGRCETELSRLPDGRLRGHERWHWESHPGSGTSVIEQVPLPPDAGGR